MRCPYFLFPCFVNGANGLPCTVLSAPVTGGGALGRMLLLLFAVLLLVTPAGSACRVFFFRSVCHLFILSCFLRQSDQSVSTCLISNLQERWRLNGLSWTSSSSRRLESLSWMCLSLKGMMDTQCTDGTRCSHFLLFCSAWRVNITADSVSA